MSLLVALESTVISHGLPYPQNINVAKELESIVEAAGCTPRTIGIIGGQIRAGLTVQEIKHLATASDVKKVSLRDLAIITAKGYDGATTVAATMWIAHKHDMQVFATGGIGGVHRGVVPGSGSMDVSADMQALAEIPMTVVCAGPKSILDLEATREMLETRGVTLIGYQTDEMPAFYSRQSGQPVDVRCDTADEIAAIIRERDRLGLQSAILVAAPIPVDYEIPADELEPAVEAAIEEAHKLNLRAAELTPFLLMKVREFTDGRSLDANLVLLRQNAQLAGEIALHLGK